MKRASNYYTEDVYWKDAEKLSDKLIHTPRHFLSEPWNLSYSQEAAAAAEAWNETWLATGATGMNLLP